MSEVSQTWELVLFVGGKSAQSTRAIRNLRELVSQHMTALKPNVTVHDLLDEPELARSENILALPTLQRASPEPQTRVIGDLSDIEKVWSVLNDG